jgi:ribosome-associated translation inhibitor RaiA
MSARRRRATLPEAAPEVAVRGVPVDPALGRRAAATVAAALAGLDVRPVRAQVTFFDDNGPKGGRAARCAVTVRLPYRPLVRAEEVRATPRQAFDAALAVLERELSRYRERRREAQRHPKKYFTAKRLLQPGG